MKKMYCLSNNEDGFVLVTAMMVLVMLTLIGTSALNTTTMEFQITGNDILAKRNFYIAESGWNCGFQWLENKASPPDRQNPSVTDPDNDSYNVVKNFGAGGDDVINDTFPDGSEDGTLTSQNIPYWYKLEDRGHQKVPGGGTKFRNFKYQITSNANRESEVEVIAEKVFKVGY